MGNITITLTPKQVDDLCHAITVCQDDYSEQTGYAKDLLSNLSKIQTKIAKAEIERERLYDKAEAKRLKKGRK